jgi:hypothetical protein
MAGSECLFLGKNTVDVAGAVKHAGQINAVLAWQTEEQIGFESFDRKTPESCQPRNPESYVRTSEAG